MNNSPYPLLTRGGFKFATTSAEPPLNKRGFKFATTSAEPPLNKRGQGEFGTGTSAQTLLAAAAVIENHRVISPAAITIENGVIAKIAATATAGKVTELGNAILLPGFTNAHCHLELTALGTLPRLDFPAWIRELGRAKVGLTAHAQADGIRDGAGSLAQSGVTTIIDHISAETPLSFFAGLPARVIGFGEILTTSRMTAEACHERVINNTATSPIQFHPTPHAVYSAPRDVLTRVMTRVHGPYSIHVAESSAEAELFRTSRGELASFLRQFSAVSERHDSTPFAELLAAQPRLGNTLIVHGNTLNADNMDQLARLKDICVVHCPGSHAYFGHPPFPYAELSKRKIHVALGTDSLASNDTLDLQAEIRRFLKCFPATDFWTLLNMVTVNALHAINVADSGMLAEGMRADIAGFGMPGDGDLVGVLKGNTRAVAVWSNQ